jgi:hypothetical protein
MRGAVSPLPPLRRAQAVLVSVRAMSNVTLKFTPLSACEADKMTLHYLALALLAISRGDAGLASCRHGAAKGYTGFSAGLVESLGGT